MGSGPGSDPAFISGTSAEFLGDKPLPRSARARPLVFVLGPGGSGKTTVARRLGGPEAMELSEKELATLVAERTRTRSWPEPLLTPRVLILDGPCFLDRRPAFARAVAELLRARVGAALRTVVTEPADGSPVRELLEAVAVEHRATLLLRFPVGRGRRRFALQVCEELGLDRSHARQACQIEPWSYRAVREVLEGVTSDE